MPIKDITGNKYGRLTVVSTSEYRKGREMMWKCSCECGEITYVRGYSLRNGDTKSCGCLREETLPVMSTTHDLSKSRLYGILSSMRKRCYNPNAQYYDRYGGRGIKVCSEWNNDFMSFYSWAIENGYEDGLTIDRKNNDGDYEPNNCRWATTKEQAQNRHNNVIIEGKCLSEYLRELAEETGRTFDALYARYTRLRKNKEAITRENILNSRKYNKKNG